MKLTWLNNLPQDPKEFLQYCKAQIKLPLEELLKLYYLTVKITSLSDSPIYKFLERTPSNIKFDEVGKREFILTLSAFTLRTLVREHLDLRLVKTLFLTFFKKLPKEFFKDCIPKHSIITSQDLIIELLTQEVKQLLPAHLKVKHLILIYKAIGTCEEIISLFPFLGNITVIKKLTNNTYEFFFPFSISEFIIFSLNLKKLNILAEETENILQNIKSFFPDCFIGEI